MVLLDHVSSPTLAGEGAPLTMVTQRVRIGPRGKRPSHLALHRMTRRTLGTPVIVEPAIGVSVGVIGAM